MDCDATAIVNAGSTVNAQMNKTDYNCLSGDSNIKWLCTRTKCVSPSNTPISQHSVQIASVLWKLDELLGKVNKIDTIFKDVWTEVSAVSNSLSNLEPRVATV